MKIKDLLPRLDQRYDLALGIDPGTHTGLAVAVPEEGARGYRWYSLQTLTLHRALLHVYDELQQFHHDPYRSRVLVVVEDARQISGDPRKKLGAGSVRRDCTIWVEFLEDLQQQVDGLEFRLVRPSARTLRKLTSEQLATYTGCQLKGSQHARDAAGLLFPYL